MTSELHITKHVKGKLKGIASINTSPLENIFCRAMATVEGTVCSKCYARRLSSFRKSMEIEFKGNSLLLMQDSVDFALPIFANVKYVRFHSYGELINEIHLKHFYAICKVNPIVKFALWTKRVELVWSLQEPVPPNLSLVYSTSDLNPPLPIIPEGFHHCYSVYTVGEPCGDDCLKCLKCWDTSQKTHIKQLLH